jgi:RNase H-fold protein (predicted Holliday junction resolvase)
MRLLWIDRWTRKIGLARRASNTKITFPLWYIDNDEHTIATISRFVTLYEIDTVIYGFVDNKRMRHQLDLCREQITMLHPMITWTWSNEAYTSIQADILLQSNHHPWQDSVAAMFILNNYLENIQKK